MENLTPQEKNSFVLYADYLRQVDRLSDAQAGNLFRAILSYASGQELPEMDDVTAMAFDFIQFRMDKDFEKYQKTAENRRESGRKGGEAKARKAKGKDSKSGNAKKNVANLHDNDIDNDSVIDNDYVDDIDNVIENDLKEKPSYEGKKKSRSVFAPPTPDDVRVYCQQQGYDLDAEYFCDFYAKKGWMVGKNKMKDWQAAVRNWVRNNDSGEKKQSSGSAYIDAINNRMDVVDEWLRKRQEVHDDG